MSSSDTDLEAGITQKIVLQRKVSKTPKSPKTKTKKNKLTNGGPSSSNAIPTEHDSGKNEGNDQATRWAYEPPEDAVLLDHASVDAGAFEWDAVKKDEDTEIWLIRVPDSIKPKYLDGLEIDPPSSSSSTPRTARIGGLTRKSASYDIWSVGDDHDEDSSDGGAAMTVGGAEELRGLTCLLPRKRKDGKLYIAPKRISRCIVVSARPPSMTRTDADSVVAYKNPPRPSYPKELLKHAFVPYGARAERIAEEDLSSMDVDAPPVVEKTVDSTAPSSSPTKDRQEKRIEKKESKGKKRKVDGDSEPKKSKKQKSNA